MTEVDDAIVIEFKVHESDEEESLQDTVRTALDQIKEKNYDAELLLQEYRQTGSVITALPLKEKGFDRTGRNSECSSEEVILCQKHKNHLFYTANTNLP